MRQQRSRKESQPFSLSFFEAFIFGASILEPNLDLSLGETQRGGELSPFRDAEILLLAELFLEGEKLLRCEGGSRLSVGLVLPERDFNGDAETGEFGGFWGGKEHV